MGSSIRHVVFIRGERLIQSLYLKGALIRYEAILGFQVTSSKF